MKKATLIATLCGLFLGAQAVAAQETAQEVTYVNDPSQGVLLNRMKDNWFITIDGGASFYMAPLSPNRPIADRFMPSAGLYAGKWFSPVFGARGGFSWLGLKGLASQSNAIGAMPDHTYTKDGDTFYKTKYAELGASFDLMINLTNWWCGYKPNRIYNSIVYVGAGGYFTFVPEVHESAICEGETSGWHHIEDETMTLRAGWINSFNVSKQVALSLDLRFNALHGLNFEDGVNVKTGSLQAYLGVTYLFKKREWTAPVVPVCPEPENCDALRARLAAADARIADLEAQLRDCLNRPVETVMEAPKGPLATVYYPIGVSRLSRENQRVVKAIAYVMQQNPDQKYLLTGWADNYTGTDNINKRLRKQRAEGVEKLLVKTGVNANQLITTTNDGDLSDLGEKCVALDRAVTIEEVK